MCGIGGALLKAVGAPSAPPAAGEMRGRQVGPRKSAEAVLPMLERRRVGGTKRAQARSRARRKKAAAGAAASPPLSLLKSSEVERNSDGDDDAYEDIGVTARKAGSPSSKAARAAGANVVRDSKGRFARREQSGLNTLRSPSANASSGTEAAVGREEAAECVDAHDARSNDRAIRGPNGKMFAHAVVEASGKAIQVDPGEEAAASSRRRVTPTIVVSDDESEGEMQFVSEVKEADEEVAARRAAVCRDEEMSEVVLHVDARACTETSKKGAAARGRRLNKAELERWNTEWHAQ